MVLLSVVSYFGQNEVKYSVISDQPPEPTLNINLSLLDFDFSTKNLDGASLNIGAFGFARLTERIEANFDIRKSYFVIGKFSFADYPGNFESSVGGSFSLGTKTVTKPTAVVLDFKEEFGYKEKTETTTSITIPANRFIANRVRGGIYFKRGPYSPEALNFESVLNPPVSYMTLTSFGIYAGIVRRSVTNVFIDTDKYGKAYNSAGRDLFIDALIVPVNNFREIESGDNVTSEVRSYANNIPVGFRAGWRLYQIEKKALTNKKFGLCGSVEVGFKPYLGWFMGGTLGLTIVKK